MSPRSRLSLFAGRRDVTPFRALGAIAASLRAATLATSPILGAAGGAMGRVCSIPSAGRLRVTGRFTYRSALVLALMLLVLALPRAATAQGFSLGVKVDFEATDDP